MLMPAGGRPSEIYALLDPDTCEIRYGEHMIEYTEQLADHICDRLIEGDSMRRICKSPDMPSRSTLLRWMADNADFEAKCARARLMQADTMDDMVVDLIEEVDSDNASAMKVKLAAIQWRASKLNPRKYGEKLDLNHSGEVAIALADRISKARSRK